MMNQIQQSLNQIAQICNQLSQNEQSNVSRLNQMQEMERSAAQQLRHAAQLCQQASSQMSQFAGGQQFTGVGQYGSYSPTAQGTYSGAGTSWSNRPVSATVSPQSFAGQSFGGGQMSQGYTGGPSGAATGQYAFNTNKDLNR